MNLHGCEQHHSDAFLSAPSHLYFFLHHLIHHNAKWPQRSPIGCREPGAQDHVSIDCPLERANANVGRQHQIQEGSQTMTNRNSPHQPVTPITDKPGAGRSLKSRNHVHVETESLFIDRLWFCWCWSWHKYVGGTTLASALTVTRQQRCTLMPCFITVLSSFVTLDF